MTRIGFIGLGVMGIPMAEKLIAAGHTLALNRIRDRSRHLVDQGGTAVDTPAAAANGADVVILMLPDTPDVETVLFGSGGVVEGLNPGTLVIDMSSISPVETRTFSEKVAAAGGHYLDAPVSGGEVGAKNGTLTIMAGGSVECFVRARPLFEVMGQNITHVGGIGDGQMCKVCNQIIVGLTIEAVSEAFLLAQRAGADVGKIREALMGGFANSRILELHGQRIVDGTFEPGFRIRLHRKDLSLALDAAKALEVAVPNTAATLQLMNAALAKGDGELDHSALYRALEHLSPTSSERMAK